MRGAVRLDKNAIARDAGPPPGSFGLSRIGIDVKMRKIAAGDVEPQAVAATEQIGDGEQPDRDFVDLTGHHLQIPTKSPADSEMMSPGDTR